MVSLSKAEWAVKAGRVVKDVTASDALFVPKRSVNFSRYDSWDNVALVLAFNMLTFSYLWAYNFHKFESLLLKTQAVQTLENYLKCLA